MNVSKNLKLLLLKLGMNGHDVSLTKEQRYSKEYGNIYSRYKLTFWHEGNKVSKKTGKKISVPETYEFTNAIELLRYMVVKSNERKA